MVFGCPTAEAGLPGFLRTFEGGDLLFEGSDFGGEGLVDEAESLVREEGSLLGVVQGLSLIHI